MLYYRRKILLALLHLFEGRLTAKSLQKYLFLFTRSQDAKSFDFVPYLYGCFSFQANQDISTMQKYGYVNVTSYDYGRFIELADSEIDYMSMVDAEDRKRLIAMKNQFGALNQNDLIKYTYQNYPFFAINSTIKETLLNEEELARVEKQKRRFEDKQLFTIGYEGITLEAYLNRLLINDVRLLCDVRKNAMSQKYGFSKNQLRTACEGVGIKYIHLPEFGIDSQNRKELNTQKDYDKLFEHYECTTLSTNPEALHNMNLIIDKYKRVALTCFEKNPLQCHRTTMAKVLLKTPDIEYTLKEL